MVVGWDPRAGPLAPHRQCARRHLSLTINIMVWRQRRPASGFLQSLVYWPAKLTCKETWSHQELNNRGRGGRKPKPQWMDNKVSLRSLLHPVYGRVLVLRGRLLCHWSPAGSRPQFYAATSWVGSPFARKINVTDIPLSKSNHTLYCRWPFYNRHSQISNLIKCIPKANQYAHS